MTEATIMRSLLVGAATVALTATAAHAELSDDKVRLGVLNDQSSLYSEINGRGSVIAAEMAVEDFGGTVLGKPIELVNADHQNKPDVASSIANRWIDEDGVDAIFDLAASSAALAVNEIGRNKNIVVIPSSTATADLTGKSCSPTTVHWTYDTWALAHGTGSAVVQAGGDSWFFLTADYAFGYALERDTSAVVEASGGKVLGSVRHPLNSSDFSSFLLQAQGSGAKVVGLANAGGDTINSIKQAAEFGLVQSGQKLAGLLIFISDVHSLGLQSAQGLQFTEGFYWDMNDQTREWSDRFTERRGSGVRPTSAQAGVYASIMHYLKAVEAAGTDKGDVVVAKMKELPTEDPLFGEGRVREDGRKIHDMYLFEVKSPEESEGPWDYYKLIRTIPGEEAFRPLDQGDCAFVKKG